MDKSAIYPDEFPETIKLDTIKWFNRAEHIAICECHRPGCPVTFISKFGRTRATRECDKYIAAIWRREYYAKTKHGIEPAKKEKRTRVEYVKLPGNEFCLSCARYTDHTNNICPCGRERCR